MPCSADQPAARRAARRSGGAARMSSRCAARRSVRDAQWSAGGRRCARRSQGPALLRHRHRKGSSGSCRSSRSTGGSPTTRSRPARCSTSGTSAGGETARRQATINDEPEPRGRPARRARSRAGRALRPGRDQQGPDRSRRTLYESPPQPRQEALTLARVLLATPTQNSTATTSGRAQSRADGERSR